MKIMNDIEPVEMDVLEDSDNEQYSHCGLDGKCEK